MDISWDYPPGRGRVRMAAAGLEIEGVSIAGHESFYKVPALPLPARFRPRARRRGLLRHGLPHARAPRPRGGAGALRLAAPARGPSPGARLRAGGRRARPRGLARGFARGSRTSVTASASCRPPRRPGVPAPGSGAPRSAGPAPGADRGLPLLRGPPQARGRARGAARPRDRASARGGGRGHAPGRVPSARLSGRLRRRDLRSGAGPAARAGAAHRVLVSAPRRPGPGARLRAYPLGRLPGARGPLRERGDRADALLAAVSGR